MKSELAQKECKPCEGHTTPLQGDDLSQMQSQLDGGWQVAGDHLEKKYEFPDFRQALTFTNRVGEIAEQQNHHPDIFLTYGEVRLQLSTHNAGGLTENDFILAAKINELG
jgi:4a-hydroxytetrahydrobiopterin dehydratase